MSAATNALNAGVVAEPVVGPANTLFAEAVDVPMPPLFTFKMVVPTAFEEDKLIFPNAIAFPDLLRI